MCNKKILLLPAMTSLTLLFLFTLKIQAQTFSPLVKQFIKEQADTFALTDATVVDGTGGPIKHHQTILIENGLIAAMGDAGSIKIPAGIKNINCTGKTIIPGMVMMHEHLFYGEIAGWNSAKHSFNFYLGEEMPISFPMLYLAGGVTTMRTTGDIAPGTDLYIRTQIQKGKMLGPDMDITAPYIEGPGDAIVCMLRIKNAQQAAQEVNYWADMGCTSVKLYENLTRAEAKAAIDAAHQHGMKVTGHLSSITYREAAGMGIDNLEHGFWACSDFDPTKKEDTADNPGRDKSLVKLDEHSPKMKALMAYLIEKGVTVTSTLPVFLPYTGREVFPGGADSAVTRPIRKEVEQIWQYEQGRDSVYAVRYRKELFWEKQFVDMGGQLIAGIDPTGAGRVIPGYADRIVPGLLMEAGFTLPQAIKICTLNAAEYLGKEKEIGSIAAGKNADLVLINDDIEKNIKNMRNTEIVFKNGVGFDSKKIFDSVKGMVGLH